ncbi:hypothetical protein NDS46_31495 (plasmid) [Paenibacillus thiaminolyticus]|uniref:hypothetical protein n=1 Tax=Paenibacillus thiaminolyticus TaxID=49283 RepID=UPI00232BEC44|nr:hypothetical protein [Paenibacillus thiaminolyticus]WCF11483.1 hypothetical protein NDS46_31495 [Paenibacillus thiaminolyticus]
MSINPERVKEILVDCLFREEELKDGKPILPYIDVEGVKFSMGFHPERLSMYKDEVAQMIANLKTDINTENGISFLEICLDKRGHLWTGQHEVCDDLIVLGIGLKLLEYVLPREMWNMCPGGLPMVRSSIANS